MEVIIGIVVVFLLVKLILRKVKQKEVQEEQEAMREAEEEAKRAEQEKAKQIKEAEDKLNHIADRLAESITNSITLQDTSSTCTELSAEELEEERALNEKLQRHYSIDDVNYYCRECKKFSEKINLPYFAKRYESFLLAQGRAAKAKEILGESEYRKVVNENIAGFALVNDDAIELMRLPTRTCLEKHLTHIYIGDAKDYYNDQLDKISRLKRKDAIIRHFETTVNKLNEAIELGHKLPIYQSFESEINTLIDDVKVRHTQFLNDIKA